MSMVIYNNVPALTSQRYLSQTNSAISKNLEKLSSGLRINSAADDASGLAISEKLRGQISGLQRASMNAQDGISLLQTAEGGLSVITEMTQRMRELAVQASNGVYTTNDRAEIQKEVDQLKEEIDRVASSTEFNTKKLLNGDSTALWSTDKSDTIDAVVNGTVAEGNYNLEIEVDPGKNYVYKSDVMSLNSDAIGATITTAGGSVNSSNVTMVTDVKGMATSGDSYYNIAIGDGVVDDAKAEVTASYQQDGSAFSINVDSAQTSVTASSGSMQGGYIEFAFTGELKADATDGATVGVKARFIDATTGVAESWQTIGSGTFDSTSGTVTIDMTAGGDGAFTNAAGDTIEINMSVSIGDAGKIQTGDEFLVAVTDDQAVSAAASGGGSITISGGPTGQTGPTITYATANSLTKKDNGDAVVDFNNVTVYHATLDETTGNLNIGSMTLNFKESGTDSGATTLDTKFQVEVRGGGEAATSSTKLSDISRFTTEDGRNIFDQTQELTVFGNGKQATIYLEGNDTLADFETKLQSAIVDGLGMGATSATSDSVSNVNNNLVNYVTTETDNSNEAVQGTFVIQTAMLGEGSQLSFAGDQALIDGLSLATIQEGANSEVTVTVTDAHTGETVGSDKVNDYVLRDVIGGMEVKIDSRAALSMSWDDSLKEMSFTAGTNENVKLHVVNNATEMQIGANEGQTILTAIPEVSTSALGIDNVLMVDQNLAQKAITQIDRALESISSTRATIGAQINRLEYTITGLDTARENLTASESRIRDLDFASEMTAFTRNQILNQAGTAMLSQANSLPQLALQLLG